MLFIQFGMRVYLIQQNEKASTKEIVPEKVCEVNWIRRFTSLGWIKYSTVGILIYPCNFNVLIQLIPKAWTELESELNHKIQIIGMKKKKKTFTTTTEGILINFTDFNILIQFIWEKKNQNQDQNWIKRFKIPTSVTGILIHPRVNSFQKLIQNQSWIKGFQTTT